MKNERSLANERVALRKESVDRNTSLCTSAADGPPSLSARRAWIEMFSVSTLVALTLVALRKESVDRNSSNVAPSAFFVASLSARRAWIEM